MENLKILLVEDEILIAMLVERQLEDVGLKISDHVTNGLKALSSIEKQAPDLILMDIRLAGSLDGIETAALIKSQFTLPIPLVFMTSYDDPSTKERAERVNPLGYFSKPLDLDKFKKLLEAHFQKHLPNEAGYVKN